MIDFHVREVLEEIKDMTSSHLEDAESLDPDDRVSSAEDLLQEIMEKIEPLLEREA